MIDCSSSCKMKLRDVLMCGRILLYIGYWIKILGRKIYIDKPFFIYRSKNVIPSICLTSFISHFL
jgi:hypothetical protein